MQNDNADFIKQLELASSQMEQELRGMERAVTKTDAWMAQAQIARVCLEQVNLARNELFGLMSELAAPPQLPDYNQFPERQEIEDEAFSRPRIMRRLSNLTEEDITAAISRAVKGRAA